MEVVVVTTITKQVRKILILGHKWEHYSEKRESSSRYLTGNQANVCFLKLLKRESGLNSHINLYLSTA